jgi:hypothetical protein
MNECNFKVVRNSICQETTRSNTKIFYKRKRVCGLNSSALGYGPVARPSEHGNEPSGSMNVGGFAN